MLVRLMPPALFAWLLLMVAMPSTSSAQFFPSFAPNATFPPGGGPITLHPRGDTEFSELDFRSPNASLVPVPQGKSTSPFDVLSSNTVNQVTFGTLGDPVLLTAPTELAVEAIGGATGILLETAFGTTSVRELLPSPIATFPLGGGPISITTTAEVRFAGLDFKSPNGNLIPAPNQDASPFTFFLANTPTQVTYGNLGSTVTFAAGSTTEMSVGAVEGADDITWAFGTGPSTGAWPIIFDFDGVVREQVPEPASGLLVILVMLSAFLVFARQRSVTLP